MDNKMISRREALKYMGVFCAGTALASTGIGAMTSCSGSRTKRLVFYFTATGNSLYVAREIAGEKGELRSISQEIHYPSPVYEAEEIGFVFPTYVHLAPAMVQDFLAKSTFKADYLFAVATFGAHHGDVVEKWDALASEHGYHFNYISSVLMVDNALNIFDMDQEKAIDKHIPEQMEKILADINSRKDYHEPVSEMERNLAVSYKQMTGMDQVKPVLGRAEKYVIVTDACVACGICKSVCPHGSWSIEDKAVPGGECEGCMACVHNCPQKAITLTPSMPGFPAERNPNARYRNPNVSLADIIQANQQRSR